MKSLTRAIATVVGGALVVAAMLPGHAEAPKASAKPSAPIDSAAVFLPGVVSTPADEYGLAVTRDWSEAYFTRQDGDVSYILVTRRTVEGWTTPSIVSFSHPGGAAHPSLSRDESTLYFVSRRSCPGAAQALNVWASDRKGAGWGPPRALGKPVTDQTIHAPSVSASGTLYASGLQRLRKTEDGYLAPERLKPDVAGSHPAVAPDESLVVFSARRPGGYGGNDLYVIFAGADGLWGPPLNLGPTVNTDAVESSPTFSSDGSALFFSRKGDIWWVGAGVVYGLRPKVRRAGGGSGDQPGATW